MLSTSITTMNRFLCTVAAVAANILIPTTLALMGRMVALALVVVLLAADTATASVLPPRRAVNAGGKMAWWRTWVQTSNNRVIPASITGWNTTRVTNVANVFEDAKLDGRPQRMGPSRGHRHARDVEWCQRFQR